MKTALTKKREREGKMGKEIRALKWEKTGKENNNGDINRNQRLLLSLNM